MARSTRKNESPAATIRCSVTGIVGGRGQGQPGGTGPRGAVWAIGALLVFAFACRQSQAEPRLSFRHQAARFAQQHGDDLIRLARRALERTVLHGAEEARVLAPRQGPPAPFGVFVTLVRGRKLRGCFGALEPQTSPVAALVVDYTISAARLDIRSRPIAPHELPDIRIIVSLAGPAESIASLELFDPVKHGILVRRGARSSVLLPGERRTSAYAMAEVRRKASIWPGEQVEMLRFSTVTIDERDIRRGCSASQRRP